MHVLAIIQLFIISVCCEYLVYDDCPLNVSRISVGTPITLSLNASYYAYGQQKLQSYRLFQNWLHYERSPPGILMNDTYYCLKLIFKDDQQDESRVAQIAEDMIEDDLVDVFLSPYSSTLVRAMLAITEDHSMVAVTDAATILSNVRYSVSVRSPAKETFDSILRVLHYRGAKTVAVFYEDTTFTRAACEPIQDIIDSQRLDLEVLHSDKIFKNPTEEILSLLFANYSSVGPNPDILIGCTYNSACINGVNALMKSSLRPNSIIFTTCAALPEFLDAVGENSTYLISGVQWERTVPYEDEMTMWSSENFHQNFTNSSGFEPSYHAAAAFAALEVIVKIIENTGSLDSSELSYELATLGMNSFYGPIEFDSSMMSIEDMINIQLDVDLNTIIVAPDHLVNGPLVYPMISWEQRNCWEVHGEGSCMCDLNCAACSFEDLDINIMDCDDATGLSKVEYSWKVGVVCRTDLWDQSLSQLVACGYIPFSSATGISLSVLSGVCGLLSVIAACWFGCHASDRFVKANQPIFLIIFSIGSFMTCLDVPLFLGKPSVLLCSGRIAVLIIGLTLMFGSILLIAFRVWKVFGNKSLQLTSFREQQMVMWLIIQLIVDAVILSVWFSTMEPSVTSKYLVNAETNEVQNLETVCSYDFRMTLICVFYKASQSMFGCAIAYSCRNVDKRILQSNYLMAASINITVIWMFFILLSNLGLDSKATIIGNIFVLLFSSLVGNAFFIVPKINLFYKMMADNSYEATFDDATKQIAQAHYRDRNVMKLPNGEKEQKIVAFNSDVSKADISKNDNTWDQADFHKTIATGGMVRIHNDCLDLTFSPHEVLELVDRAGELEDEISRLMKENKRLKELTKSNSPTSIHSVFQSRNTVSPVADDNESVKTTNS